MHFKHILVALAVLLLSSGWVLAYDPACDFNGSVRLNKSDLPSFTRDQLGCGLQRVNDNVSILIISGFVLIGLVILYGMWKVKKW
jgi:hypothetical protein